MLLQQGSHDQSHDLDSALPLVGSQCIHIVHYITHGALDAYSAFLASLVGEELEGLPRGVVYLALKRATTVSPHEAGLQGKADSFRTRHFNQEELKNAYGKCKRGYC